MLEVHLTLLYLLPFDPNLQLAWLTVHWLQRQYLERGTA